MQRIVIDLDDVICTGGFLRLVNEFLKTNYTEEDNKGYYLTDLVPKERKEEWEEFYFSHDLYDYVTLLPEVESIMKQLYEKYEIYIVSAYVYKANPLKSGIQTMKKYDWLAKTFPYMDPRRFVFLCNKDIISCDIRIDDKMSNLEGEASKKFLFTAYHNKNYTDEELQEKGIERVNSWKEIAEKLL